MNRLILTTVFSLIASVALQVHAQDITRLGGDLTSTLPGRHAIQVGSPSITDNDRFAKQLSGFPVFHTLRTSVDGLGPVFNSRSCGSCHVNNGKGAAKFNRTLGGGSSMVVKVSLPGLQPDGSPRDVPGIGEQLQDHQARGKPLYNINLTWDPVTRKYSDGKTINLRRPKLSFVVPGYTSRKLVSSLRMTPAIIGPGLLEAVSTETILEFSDPDDVNGDGISGKPNFVKDIRTGETMLGRFGFRARHTTMEEQSASAAFLDVGVTNPLFPGSTQAPLEMSEDDLSRLTIYQTIAGVPPARSQDDPKVLAGKARFTELKCDSCHRMTLTTGVTKDPELSNQTIHPFTDLLLHDMGADLSDKRPEFSATGKEWRTTPLWGLGFTESLSNIKPVYLHDGRAETIEAAIVWHGGEALAAKNGFMKLTSSERDELIAFLRSL